MPSMVFFFLVTFHPFHHGISFSWRALPFSVRLTPRNPDIRRGLELSRFGGFTTRSRASNRFMPSMVFFFLVTFHPFHHGISFSWRALPFSVRLTPRNPDI